MKCGYLSLVGVAGQQAGVYPLRCKRWGCTTCGPRKARATLARTRAGMRLGTVRFFTLTSPSGEEHAASYAAFSARWKQFHMRLARRFGKIEYLGVVEPQKRGAAHIHVVYRGPYIPQPWLSQAAQASGFGRIADIRRSNPRLMSYLAKYLTKELSDPRLAPPKYFRRARWSAGWCVWEPRTRAVPWTDWWIADAVPLHAAISAARRGYQVTEVVTDHWEAPFAPARIVRWSHDLQDLLRGHSTSAPGASAVGGAW